PRRLLLTGREGQDKAGTYQPNHPPGGAPRMKSEMRMPPNRHGPSSFTRVRTTRSSVNDSLKSRDRWGESPALTPLGQLVTLGPATSDRSCRFFFDAGQGKVVRNKDARGDCSATKTGGFGRCQQSVHWSGSFRTIEFTNGGNPTIATTIARVR